VLRQLDNGELSIVPLNPLPLDISENEWGCKIGFGVSHPSELLPVTTNKFAAASQFEGCCFLTDSGEPLTAVPIPTYTMQDNPSTESGMPLPHFA
jgi:hypothetical protein